MSDDLSNRWTSMNLELIPPGVFRPGFVVELTSTEFEQLVVRRYYLSEYESLMDEDVVEFPIFEKEKNKENIWDFLRGAWNLINKRFGRVEKLYLDKAAAKVIEKAS